MTRFSRTLLWFAVGIAFVVCVYLFSRPEVVEPKRVSSENIEKELKSRSFYTNLPITFSSEQVGKTNPFK